MKMRWSVARVARISNVAEYVPGIDDVSGPEAAVPIEVRVVVHLSSRAEDVDDLSTELVVSCPNDNAFRGTQDRRAAIGKDVDAFMRSSSAPRRAP